LKRRLAWVALIVTSAAATGSTSSEPLRATHGMVVSQEAIASKVGVDVLKAGGSAVDAAVATAFALAVVHPTAGNIGGGGFIVYRPASGDPVAVRLPRDGPRAATPTMFLTDGKYDEARHHDSHLSVGVPGTVAGLHLAWKEGGKLPWERLVEPAVALARDGFPLSESLAASLAQGAAVDEEVPGLPRAVLEERRALRAGEALHPAGPRADAGADRGPGPRGLLRRRDGAAHRA